jgi:diguanylate cyclase (GGDEF)-like protein
VYVDVDNLKSVNDVLGHTAGDKLLCEVADGLKRHVRAYDLVVRLGGDEFLCALSDVSLENAHARFDDLNDELHEASMEGSVSVGFAALRDGEGSEDLVDRADRDLLAVRRR